MIFPFTRWQPVWAVTTFQAQEAADTNSKTIQVNEDKEHQLDLRWLEAYRSQDPHFGFGAHGSSLSFERKSSLRLSRSFMLGDQWQRLYHCYLVPTLEAGRFTGWSLYLSLSDPLQ